MLVGINDGFVRRVTIAAFRDIQTTRHDSLQDPYLRQNLLTQWSRVLLEKLSGSQLVKNFLSQLDPVYTPTSHFLNIHLNIILPSTPGSSKWSRSLRFSHQNPLYTSLLPHTCYMPRPSHSFCYYSLIYWDICCYTGRYIYKRVLQSNAKLVLKLRAVLIHFWL